MQTVSGGVEAHIKTDLFLLQEFFQSFFGGTLVNETALFQVVKRIDVCPFA